MVSMKNLITNYLKYDLLDSTFSKLDMSLSIRAISLVKFVLRVANVAFNAVKK